MTPTLEQIKTDESVWPDGATHYRKGTKFFYRDLDSGLERCSLQRGEWKESAYSCISEISNIIPRPTKAEWVPEVGVECEVYNDSFEYVEWEKCTPLFIGDYKAVYDSESCHERVCAIKLLKFRPIKSERDKLAELISLNIKLEISPIGIANAILHKYTIEEKEQQK